MTPRLTHADASAVYSRLKTLLDQDISLPEALQELLGVEEVRELLTPDEFVKINAHFNTVMDMARLEAGEEYTPNVDHLAQEL